MDGQREKEWKKRKNRSYYRPVFPLVEFRTKSAGLVILMKDLFLTSVYVWQGCWRWGILGMFMMCPSIQDRRKVESFIVGANREASTPGFTKAQELTMCCACSGAGRCLHTHLIVLLLSRTPVTVTVGSLPHGIKRHDVTVSVIWNFINEVEFN